LRKRRCDLLLDTGSAELISLLGIKRTIVSIVSSIVIASIAIASIAIASIAIASIAASIIIASIAIASIAIASIAISKSVSVVVFEDV